MKSYCKECGGPLIHSRLYGYHCAHNREHKGIMRVCDDWDHVWRPVGQSHTVDGKTIYYRCAICGAEDSS